EELKASGLEQKIPAEIQNEGSKHRAEHITETAEEAVQHEVDRIRDGERRRIDRLRNGREHRAADAAEERRQRVGENADISDIDADRGCQFLVLLQGLADMPDPRMNEPVKTGETKHH